MSELIKHQVLDLVEMKFVNYSHHWNGMHVKDSNRAASALCDNNNGCLVEQKSLIAYTTALRYRAVICQWSCSSTMQGELHYQGGSKGDGGYDPGCKPPTFLRIPETINVKDTS